MRKKTCKKKRYFRCLHSSQQVVFEGTVGRGHQSDIAIDEVGIETCGEGGGDQCKVLLIPFYIVPSAFVYPQYENLPVKRAKQQFVELILSVRDIPRKGYTRYVTNLLFKRSDQNIEITCQNNYVLRENEMAGEGRIVFVSFWVFVRNFHTNCVVD